MDNLPEVECSIQGCRLVELDVVIYIYIISGALYRRENLS